MVNGVRLSTSTPAVEIYWDLTITYVEYVVDIRGPLVEWVQCEPIFNVNQGMLFDKSCNRDIFM